MHDRLSSTHAVLFANHSVTAPLTEMSYFTIFILSREVLHMPIRRQVRYRGFNLIVAR